MKVLSWTGISRRPASIQTVRDLVRRSVYLPHTKSCGTISTLVVNIFIVLTYYHYIFYLFSLDNILWCGS